MFPIPDHIIKSVQKQQELLNKLSIIKPDSSFFKEMTQSAQMFYEDVNPVRDVVAAQSKTLEWVVGTTSVFSQQYEDIIRSLLPSLALLEELIEFKKLQELMKSGKLHFPYPYTTETLILVADEKKKETDLRNDILKKLRSGVLLETIEGSAINDIEFGEKPRILNLIRVIFNSLADPKNELYLETIWIFPITEKLIQKFFQDNIERIKTSLEAIRDQIELNGEDSDNSDRIDDAIEKIEAVQHSTNVRLDLGMFLRVIELSILDWLHDEVYQIISISILSKFVNLRNDIIHGRLLGIKPKHVTIALSLFITILNILFVKNAYEPILFELGDE